MSVIFRLTVEYDGTEFAGWQVQPGRRTVQGVLTLAIQRTTGGRSAIVRGAGRTDAGVHAAGQVAAVRVDWKHGPERFMEAVNRRLPVDLSIVACNRAAARFDPRRDAVARAYRYAILSGVRRGPLARRCAWAVPGALSVRRMAAAARVFKGRHDFSSFTTMAGRGRGAVRAISRIGVRRRGPLILIDVTGRSFLHHLVRTIAGEVVAAGQGRSGPAEIRSALTRRGFRAFRWIAPPQGLCLLAVRYPGVPPRPAPGWPPGVV